MPLTTAKIFHPAFDRHHAGRRSGSHLHDGGSSGPWKLKGRWMADGHLGSGQGCAAAGSTDFPRHQGDSAPSSTSEAHVQLRAATAGRDHHLPGAAALAQAVGFSVALGAFLAGVSISSLPELHQHILRLFRFEMPLSPSFSLRSGRATKV